MVNQKCNIQKLQFFLLHTSSDQEDSVIENKTHFITKTQGKKSRLKYVNTIVHKFKKFTNVNVSN